MVTRNPGIFKLQRPVIKHILHQVRQEVRRSFSSKIWDYIRPSGTATKTKAMTRIFLGPFAILLVVPLKNDPRRRKADGTTMSTIMIKLKHNDVCRAGFTLQLWKQAKKTRKLARSAQPRTKEQPCHNRVLNLVQEGRWPKQSTELIRTEYNLRTARSRKRYVINTLNQHHRPKV